MATVGVLAAIAWEIYLAPVLVEKKSPYIAAFTHKYLLVAAHLKPVSDLS